MQLSRPAPYPLSTSSSSSPFVTYVGIAGLSLATLFGTFKFVKVWKHVRQSWLDEKETRRKQKVELDLLKRSLSETQADAEQAKKSAASYAEEIKLLKTRLSGSERDLEEARRQNRTLSEQMKSLDTRNKQLEGELQRKHLEHQDTVELLRARTSELKGSQTFLTKADQLSGAEVIKFVEELNAEIMQTAAIMAEGFVIEEKKVDKEGKDKESDELREVYARVEEIVGPRMSDLLRTSEHHEDPILIQIAFQTAMSAYTHWIISSWCFESPDDEHMLSEVYARVRETEEQAVSGRWRQLTRTHLQRMLTYAPDLSTDMAEAFANILVAAGLKDTPAALHEQIMTCFGERIQLVMKYAQQLNKKIGEGITSCDLEALYIAPDVTYNSGSMEDYLGADDLSPAKPQEQVLCTTDLGLVRAEKVSGTTGEWQESVLLRPKVVLPSGLVGIVSNAEW
ncbi:hypothetical protein B0H34DRAFT_653515 [Crassisporium funariophilum]|nr:hypothetical protein B0H34DRAFT_653515 [Crassisporium funariophilum]